MTNLVIHNDTSLRDILAAYPQTRPVLSRYGLMECGGVARPTPAGLRVCISLTRSS